MCAKCLWILHMQSCKQCNLHILSCEERGLEMTEENAEEYQKGLCRSAQIIIELGVRDKIDEQFEQEERRVN
jgi:hypothetical protein